MRSLASCGTQIVVRAVLAWLLVVAAMGSLQYARASTLLSTQSVFRDGTTSAYQLSRVFAQKVQSVRYLQVGGELADAQRALFWFGEWTNLGPWLVGCPVQGVGLLLAIVAALGGVPVLAICCTLESRRLVQSCDWRTKVDLLARVSRRACLPLLVLSVGWVPLVWWIASDRGLTRAESFGQWPGARDGMSAGIGVGLLGLLIIVSSVAVCLRAARQVGIQFAIRLSLCPSCGYDRGQERERFPACPECGQVDLARSTQGVGGTWITRGGLGIAAGMAVGVVGIVVWRAWSHPDGAWSWARLSPALETRPFLVSRVSDVLELTTDNDHVLVAWHVAFTATGASNYREPARVVTAWTTAGHDWDPASAIHVESTVPRTLTPAVQWSASIPAGCCELHTLLTKWEPRLGEHDQSLAVLTFDRIRTMRRWDPGDPDRRVRSLVDRLELARTSGAP